MHLTKITCICCGKQTKLPLKKSKSKKAKKGYRKTIFTYLGPEIPDKERWLYFGEIDIKSNLTEKYCYKFNSVTEYLNNINIKNHDKELKKYQIKNIKYNPKIKPKYVQCWVCPDCRDSYKETDDSCVHFENSWCKKHGWQITNKDECPCDDYKVV